MCTRALVTFPWPCFPVSPVLEGLPGVSVAPSGPVQGDPTRGLGQQSHRNGDFTEVAPKSLSSSCAGHEAGLAPKSSQQHAWLAGICCSLSLTSPPTPPPSKM